MSFDIMLRAVPIVLEGFLVTVTLLVTSFALGQALALPLALARTSKNRWLNWPVLTFTFIERGTPLLVQLFIIYFGLAQLESVRESIFWPLLRDPMPAAILAFGLNSAAYSAELLRGALINIPDGQYEAAKTLGLSRFAMYFRVILPQAYRDILPVIGNEAILVLKATALASTVTVMDMTGAARNFTAQTYAPFEVFFIAGIIYLGLSLLLARAFDELGKRISVPRHN
ncbi:MAG: ABC transporter permease subunit [Litoreibacter sp.]